MATMAKLGPTLNLESIPGWGGLQEREQNVIRDQTRLLFETIHETGKQRLKIGEHLFRLREILKPHRGMFERYLKTCRFSRPTAFRMMDDYNAARTILPMPIMQVALMRPNQRLDAKMIKASPPPKTNDITEINKYLDTMTRKSRAKQIRDAENDPDVMKKQAFNSVRNFYDRLPKGRGRINWIRDVSAMLLTYGGVDDAVAPIEIPDGMVNVLGRPRKLQA